MNDGARGRSISGDGPTPLALASGPLLEQRLVSCPQCGLLSAVHVDQQAWRVVRFVCPTSCRLEPAVVEALIGPDTSALIA